MLSTQARGSTLLATLAALLLGWCAIEGVSDEYGLHASFDGAQIKLRLTLPSICLSATLLAEVTTLKSVSVCTHCSSQERSWS